MQDKKSQNCQLVKSMVHGKPSRPQSANKAIYDIFNWGHNDQSQPQSHPAHNVKTVKSDQNQYINVKQTTQSCHQPLQTNNKLNNIHQNNQNAQQNIVNNQYMLGKPKKSLRPHKIQQQLYMYDNVHLKRALSSDNNSKTQKQQKQKIKRNETKKLNENDEKDRQIIKRRKQKLKQFKLSTRQLPNSAFTTYYGKPAFQSYGRCNSSANLKTHNVMPHKGQNHPQDKQTYQSALIKGKNLKTQNHLPRKPIQQPIVHKDGKQQSKLLHLPLQKPDLINHVRFSEPKITSDRKQPVPSFQQLKKSFRKPAKQQKIKKHKKTSKSAIEYDDGLKFMNNRDHLLNLIEAKKTRDSRVAYKVTQCYPPKAQAELSRRKTESQNDYSQFQRPAGIAQKKSDHAEVVIYRRY